jgi:hypothetical protein
VILPRRQGSRDPLVKIETPPGTHPFLSGYRCRSRALTRAFFAVVFDHSTRNGPLPPPLCVTKAARASNWEFCGACQSQTWMRGLYQMPRYPSQTGAPRVQ